jgi:hypothetical protein
LPQAASVAAMIEARNSDFFILGFPFLAASGPVQNDRRTALLVLHCGAAWAIERKYSCGAATYPAKGPQLERQLDPNCAVEHDGGARRGEAARRCAVSPDPPAREWRPSAATSIHRLRP